MFDVDSFISIPFFIQYIGSSLSEICPWMNGWMFEVFNLGSQLRTDDWFVDLAKLLLLMALTKCVVIGGPYKLISLSLPFIHLWSYVGHPDFILIPSMFFSAKNKWEISPGFSKKSYFRFCIIIVCRLVVLISCHILQLFFFVMLQNR